MRDKAKTYQTEYLKADGKIEVRSVTVPEDDAPQAMTGLSRCPDCFLVPKITIEDDSVTIECERHGHMAMGATLDVARVNWNQYTSYVKTTKAA